jgi:acyl-CoA synthetase (NDP forming)
MGPVSQDLGVLFAPRSVAVIGASNRAGSVGQAVFANVFKHGYAGVVYPVNPKAASVMSVKAFPSVLAIPDPVDLSIIIVPSALVPEVMEECGKKSIKAAIVASLERLSQMVLDFAELKELDINPFMVFDEGQGAAVVDARIFIG